MPSDPVPSRAVIAGNFEDEVGYDLAQIRDATADQVLAIAQVKATIALGQRVAALTDELGVLLGDDSKLDRIAEAARAIAEPGKHGVE